jgi:hypothetical protein
VHAESPPSWGAPSLSLGQAGTSAYRHLLFALHSKSSECDRIWISKLGYHITQIPG